MPARARGYILTVILVGMALSILALRSLVAADIQWPVLLVLVFFATLAHLFVLMGIGSDAWAINLVFLFAGVVLLQPASFVILVVIPHLIEWGVDVWVKKSARLRNWYIQPYNIAAHLISGLTAHRVYVAVAPEGTPIFASAAFVAAMAAVLVYVGLNHVLIALALMLARGKTLQQTGMFELGNLFGDLVQTILGYLWAVCWKLNPWLVLPVLAPLVVIYRTLTIPKLKRDAQTDAKTGLFNARYAAEALTAEFAKARRFGHPLSVIMADLDLLRRINNTYGHLAGDAVLIGVARVIREMVGEYGVASRFGGEEFSVILPRFTEPEAGALAEQIRRSVAQLDVQVDSHPEPIHITMSLGVAELTSDIPLPKDLVHEADVAVYQAKLQGRDRVVWASAVPRSAKLESQASDARLESPYAAAFAPQPAIDETAGDGRRTGGSGVESSGPAPGSPADRPPLVGSTATPTRPGLRPRGASSQWLGPFVGSIVAGGLLTASLGLHLDSPVDYTAILLFAVLAGLAEYFQVDLYGDGSISVSMALSFAAALVAGIPAVVSTSTAIAVVQALHRRSAPYKVAFGWSNHVLAALAPMLLISAQGISLQIANLPLLAVMAALAAMGYFIIETGLFSTAIALTEGRQPLAVWRTQYRWLSPHYLLLGLMGALLALAYVTLGGLGVVVFTFPVLMMRFAQKAYVDRTHEGVRELKRMNQQLTLANNEIIGASRAIRQLNDELFLTLSKIIDARDPYVAGHATKVAEYAVAVGTELGLPAERIETLRHAAFLHDIGKLGISEKILTAESKLDPQQLAIIRRHPALGAEFLETSQALRHLAPFVRSHHERWDGKGYPDGLAGEEIPLEGRILGVCDAVEAMASDRPYHPGKPMSGIVRELKRCSGRQFDPAVVEAFLRYIAREGLSLVVNSADEVTEKQGRQGATEVVLRPYPVIEAAKIPVAIEGSS